MVRWRVVLLGSCGGGYRTLCDIARFVAGGTGVAFGVSTAQTTGPRNPCVPTVAGMFRPDLHEALRDRDAVLRAFLAPDGTLTSIPTKIRKRLVVLDLLAQEFDL